MRETANRLLSALSGYAGCPDFELDDLDTGGMVIQGIPFTFFYSDESEELFSCASIGEPPKGLERTQCLRELLRGNFSWAGTGGGILGIDKIDGQVCLSRRYSLESETEPSFLENVAIQVGLAKHWQGVIAPKSSIPVNMIRS